MVLSGSGAVRLSSLLRFDEIAFSLIPCVQVHFRSLSDDANTNCATGGNVLFEGVRRSHFENRE